MRSSSLQTTITFVDSWIRKVWAPDKSAGLKNFLNTTSELTTARARQTELPMPYHNTLSGVLRKKHPLLQERQDFAPSAVITGQSLQAVNKSTFPSPPDPHMRNDCLFPTEPVLEPFPRRNSSWQSLYCQYRRHEVTTLRAAGKQRGNKAFQRLYGSSGGLKRCRRSALVSRAPIRPSNHPFQGDKLLPQWSSWRAFWYWKDKGVGWPEILLAKPEERRWKLCPGMRRLSGLKSHPP